MVAKTSSSWPDIQQVGRFCVNVFARDQEELCKALSRPSDQRFDGVAATLVNGMPRLQGVVAYVDCEVAETIEAGDHLIVVGRVTDLEVARGVSTLQFHQGTFGTFQALRRADATHRQDLSEIFRAISVAQPQMDGLAKRFRTECTALAAVDGDLILVAAAGLDSGSHAISVPVGHRLPYRAPLGTIFAAWGSAEAVDNWIRAVNPRTEVDEEACRRIIERVREDGYAIAIAESESVHMAVVRDQYSASGRLTLDVLRSNLDEVFRDYNQYLESPTGLDFQFVSAPVLDHEGRPLLSLSLWGPDRSSSQDEVEECVEALARAARDATTQLSTSTRAPS